MKIDLKARTLFLPISVYHKRFLGIYTRFGYYEYMKMTSGLKNSATHVQREM